jgi:hypothetical protein
MLCCFFFTFVPFWSAAQTPSGGSDTAIPVEDVSGGSDTAIPVEDASGGSDAAIPVEDVSGGSDTAIPVEDASGGFDAALPAEGASGGSDAALSDGGEASAGPSVDGEAPLPDEDARPVAIMAFLGDDLAVSAELQGGVVGELQTLGGYRAGVISAEELPESLEFLPDTPPEPEFLGDSELALTGEYYVDMDNIQHFQLWLWNSDDGSLVATEEMIFEDMEEAQSYMPAIVNWLFARADVEAEKEERFVFERVIQQVEPEQAAAPLEAFSRRFFMGLRLGGSLSNLTVQGAGNYEGGASQWFGFEGAVMAEFRLFRFLSLQVEAVFVYDAFVAAKQVSIGGELIRSTDAFEVMFLMFPLYLKAPLALNGATMSPFLGAYFPMPLGQMNISPQEGNGEGGSYSYGIIPPLGISLGLDVGFPLGPGELVAGLRFDQNIGMSVAQDPNRMRFYRSRLGLSLGYQFLLWKQKQKDK